MLAELQAQVKALPQVTVQAVHVGNQIDKVKTMLTKHSASGLGQAAIDDLSLLQPLGVFGLPATLVEINGQIQYVAHGYLGEDAKPLANWLTCLRKESQ